MVRPDGSTLDWNSSVNPGWATLASPPDHLDVILGLPSVQNEVAVLQVPMNTPAPPSDWFMLLCPQASDTLDAAANPTCTTASGSTEAPLQVPLVGAVQTPQPAPTLDVLLTASPGDAVTVNVQVSSEIVTIPGQCLQSRDCQL